jgi:hypothetical protein
MPSYYRYIYHNIFQQKTIIKMEILSIQALTGLALAIISFFLKDLFNRFKETRNDVNELHDEHVRLMAKIDRIDEKVPTDIANLEKVMNIKFEQFNVQFEELKRAIVHAENTMKANTEAFLKLLQDTKK